MSRFHLAKPNQDFVEQFFLQSLQDSKAYQLDDRQCEIKIDQNESPWDWPTELKNKILTKLVDIPWNRYPKPFDEELNELIGRYANVPATNVLTGPGSNHLITMLLSTLMQKRTGKLVIARPSFALYEMHCRYEDIPYEVWPLDDNLEYSLDLLPELTPGSVVVFASPNNPVGNVLSLDSFKKLLDENPHSLFIADEAYFEFIDKPYTELLESHSNVILVRTFSKTLGAASLRLGYLIAPVNVLHELRKVRLPFLLNNFTLVAAKEILKDPDMIAFREKVIKTALSERARLANALREMPSLGASIKEPFANFILMKFENDKRMHDVYEGLIKDGIIVRNVSKGPGLAGCLRMTVGTEIENDKVIETLNKLS